ncbi:hypothetical protein BZA05DRAFT_475227 [Tricharina praecox]|uniref:uncharacterized protein n=1 Tax=Tricharina praecox TaxID=43433 RepID=UPI002220F0E9|nr:uncharacterized protein BZA05DRAFT_475227 [Tricharina praecox]KAI5848912.1 hypothetical protein BZA05DRAFT_475227 [Tricharina praecox]
MKDRPAKRTRRAPSDNGGKDGDRDGEDGAAEAAARDALRRHFEERFGALEGAPVATPATPATKGKDKGKKEVVIDDGSNEDEDDGLEGEGEDDEEDSGDEDSGDDSEEDDWEDDGVVAVFHGADKRRTESLSKREKRAFMSSKPPSLLAPTPTTTAPAGRAHGKSPEEKDDDAGEDEALNLKNDLALQQLLRESHLLEGGRDGSLEATGAARLKALNIRIEALGGKRDVAPQKMAMHMKKGIEGKKVEREKKRRREAKESGIVLEKEVKEFKKRKRGGMAGVDNPGVGRFKDGALVLSKRDVESITGGSGGRGKGGKRGGRGGGKGGGRGGGRGRGKRS